MCVCVRVCVCACARACVRACVCVCVYIGAMRRVDIGCDKSDIFTSFYDLVDSHSSF